MIRFTKMHGLGNDFVVIDAIHQKISLTPQQIRFIADRHFGVGCDQLLLVERPTGTDVDFKYRIFNADGGEVAQCGNGARCFARFVRDKKLSDADVIRVETDAGRLLLRFDADGMITVDMGIPKHDPASIPMTIAADAGIYTADVNGAKMTFGAVSMGNPHAVLLVDDIATAPVAELGPLLENLPIFPERANIGFMHIVARDRVKLRVYERGAAETLACGSGACAAAVIGIEQNLLDHRVNVELPGGTLTIEWLGRGRPVLMTGPATTVFEGSIEL